MEKQVLLVDDDRMVLFLHKILVEGSQLPSNPLTFTSGKEVFSFLKNADPNTVYIIMLDLNMPEMNGWECLESMHDCEICRNIFVVIVTSSINSEDKKRALMFPQVIDYVEKPLSNNVCNRIVEKVETLQNLG